MSSGIRRMAPAVAVAGLASGLVLRFDTAFVAGTPEEPRADVGALAVDSTDDEPAADPIPADPTPTDGPAVADGCVGTPVDGPLVSTEWGPIQVVAEVEDGVVCAATAVVHPDGDRRSLQINDAALPVIDARVAESGDASFDVVTGATVTSEGYRTSLQAILDQS